jgi:hypothetical protein
LEFKSVQDFQLKESLRYMKLKRSQLKPRFWVFAMEVGGLERRPAPEG